MTMKVSRFALTYSPPTLMVEYRDLTDDSKYVKKINIKNIANVKKSEVLVNELRAKYPNLLGPNIVEEAQIKGLVERLMDSAKKTGGASTSAHNNNKIGASTATAAPASGGSSTGGGTVMFKRAAVPTTESEIANLDLNVVSDEVNQTAKRIMDSRFEANRLKPGDEGYVWDKAVDFGKPSEAADWDDDEEEEGEEGEVSDEYDF